MRGAFGKQRNHNKEETILHISVENKQEQPIPYHRRTVPSHTVPIHTNTVHTYSVHTIWAASTFFFLFFFVSPFPLSSILSFFLSLAISHFVGLYLRHSLFLFPLPSSLPSTLLSLILCVSLQLTLW